MINASGITQPGVVLASQGHRQQDSSGGHGRQYNKREKSTAVCGHCGGKGHPMTECFQLKGFPDWWESYQMKKKKDTGGK
ncbi:hypothetical protein PSY31_22925, partial [Shigella flexneri]|nr:hypothetical protein [Shigella flexneri]